MDRITAAEKVITDAAGNFVDANAATGQVGSFVPAAFHQMVEDEIINVEQAAGLTPSRSNHTQLLSALRALLVSRLPSGAAIPTTNQGYAIHHEDYGLMRWSGTAYVAPLIYGALPTTAKSLTSGADVKSDYSITLPAAGTYAIKFSGVVDSNNSWRAAGAYAGGAVIRLKTATGTQYGVCKYSGYDPMNGSCLTLDYWALITVTAATTLYVYIGVSMSGTSVTSATLRPCPDAWTEFFAVRI